MDTMEDNTMHYEPLQLKFLMRSVYGLLLSPAILHRWGLVEDPKCQPCDKPGTMQHALSSCQTALAQGRYRRRQDTVLRELAEMLERERRKKQHNKKKASPAINFVKESQTGESRSRETACFFQTSSTPHKRPDIVIWSPNAKKLVMVQLTVPGETRCEEAYKRKFAKYTELQEQCRSCGWSTWLFSVEIGCRGFPAQSVWRTLDRFGIKAGDRKRTVGRLCRAAEKGSNCWLLMKRDEKS